MTAQYDLTIHEAHDALERGEFSSVELTLPSSPLPVTLRSTRPGGPTSASSPARAIR